MRKVAITIEHTAGGGWKVTSGPSEDVAAHIAGAKLASVTRGGGDGVLMVVSTNGIEKRYKIAPPAIIKKGNVK